VPYKLQLVQALKTDDKQRHRRFSFDMQEKLEEHLVFNDETMFHTMVKPTITI